MIVRKYVINGKLSWKKSGLQSEIFRGLKSAKFGFIKSFKKRIPSHAMKHCRARRRSHYWNLSGSIWRSEKKILILLFGKQRPKVNWNMMKSWEFTILWLLLRMWKIFSIKFHLIKSKRMIKDKVMNGQQIMFCPPSVDAFSQPFLILRRQSKGLVVN